MSQKRRYGYCKRGIFGAGAKTLPASVVSVVLAADEVFETVGKMDRPRFLQRRGIDCASHRASYWRRATRACPHALQSRTCHSRNQAALAARASRRALAPFRSDRILCLDQRMGRDVAGAALGVAAETPEPGGITIRLNFRHEFLDHQIRSLERDVRHLRDALIDLVSLWHVGTASRVVAYRHSLLAHWTWLPATHGCSGCFSPSPHPAQVSPGASRAPLMARFEMSVGPRLMQNGKVLAYSA